jgi:hypothetical protein
VAAETGGPSAAHGAAFGLALWAAGYMGWVPALGFSPAAHRESPPRNGLMISAHVVWGATVGLLVSAAGQRRERFSRHVDA